MSKRVQVMMIFIDEMRVTLSSLEIFISAVRTVQKWQSLSWLAHVTGRSAVSLRLENLFWRVQ